MIDQARFLKTKIKGPNLGPTGVNQFHNEVFHHFLESGSLVFLEIAYNNSLQQFLTSKKGKIRRHKFGGPKFGQNKPKSGPKLGFLPFSQVFFSFP